MKKLILISLLLLIITMPIFGQRKPIIAYLPIISNSMSENESKILVNYMEEELVKSSLFIIIRNEDVQEISNEMDLDLSMDNKLNLIKSASKIGMILASDYVLFTEFTRNGNKIVIRANLIDLFYAKILTTEVIEADENTSLKNMVRQIVVDAVYKHFDQSYNAENEYDKKAICVVDIEPNNGVSKDEALAVTHFVFDSLFRFGEKDYTVIDFLSRNKALDEIEFSLSGLTSDSTTAIQVGNFIEADYMLFGNFILFGSSFYVSLNIVDVETTKVLGSLREKCATLDDIEPSVDYLVRELLLMVK